jgi:hypothetical protein
MSAVVVRANRPAHSTRNVGKAQLAPRLARTGQVGKQLADVVELLVNRALRVAAMLTEMEGVVA